MSAHTITLPRLLSEERVSALCATLPDRLACDVVEVRFRNVADLHAAAAARLVEEIIVRRHGAILPQGTHPKLMETLFAAAKGAASDGHHFLLIPERPEDMVFRYGGVTCTLTRIIAHMELIPENRWGVDVVRSGDGTQDCFFGHLFRYGQYLSAFATTVPAADEYMGSDEKFANRLWEWFEDTWATTYQVYPVNDGENPAYRQATPKQRVLAYLRALNSGAEHPTQDSMHREMCRREHADCCQSTTGKDSQ